MPPLPTTLGLIALGCLPGFVWLAFYLRRDCHPEPRYLIAKTFLMGIIVSPVAIAFQLLFIQLVQKLRPGLIEPKGAGFFLWAAFVEEFVKFYAVKSVAMTSPEFDEPVDAMIYMITAALGFATMENILVLFRTLQEGLGVHGALSVWGLRFAGATLLHALSSGLMGYFLAIAWFYRHHRSKLVVVGLGIATLFHFTFNIFLANPANEMLSLVQSTFLLLVMAFLVSILFDKIRERHARRISAAVTEL